jgi:hypothetical protein
VENDGDSLWRLLDPVLRQLPDQGIEAGAEPVSESKGEKRKAESGQPAAALPAPAKALITCLICKKKHEPLCPLPDDFRQKQRDRKKARRAEKRVAKAKAKAAA